MKEPFEKPPFFDHEKLVAYRRSGQSIAWSTDLLDQIPAKLSVPLNIAEANGKYTPPDPCRYFESARGCVLECAACLDVLVSSALSGIN